jgi:hypothetical protein
MLMPIFILALDPNSQSQSKKNQNTKQIVPHTSAQLEEENKKRTKQTTKPIDELQACRKLFAMNSNRDINELYTEFSTSNPSSDVIDFLEYLYQTGISISGRSNETEKAEIYQVLMITSTDKKVLNGLLEYSNEESISRYCIAYGLKKTPKRMSQKSILLKFGNTRTGQFSKVYYANGLYRVYYLYGSSFEAVNYFEKLNQGAWKFSRDVTLLGRSLRF